MSKTSTIKIAFKVKAKNSILQDYIDKKGMNQADFARLCGERQDIVGKWFNMKDYPRTQDKMFRLSELVHASPEEIFPDLLRDKIWMKGERAWTIHREMDINLFPIHNFPQLASSNDPEAEINKQEMRVNIDKTLASLTPREEKVIRLRLGLDGDIKTLREVGEMFGLQQERIRQIEAKAIRKLRHPSRRIYLEDYQMEMEASN